MSDFVPTSEEVFNGNARWVFADLRISEFNGESPGTVSTERTSGFVVISN